MAEPTTDYSVEGGYMGGNIGISAATIEKERITRNITNPSYTDDDRDLGYKLVGGYQFNKYFAIEGGYFDLGKFGYSLSTLNGTANGNIKIKGVNLDAVAILPITESFSALGRVGANYAQAKDSFSSTGNISFLNTNPKEDDLNYKFGAGLQYAITDAVRIRLEAERYRINDAVGNLGDVDLFSIGLTYKFGATQEVAAVSEKEKVPIVVTVPDAPAKIEESVTVVLAFEDIHFEFDKSTLNKKAKNALKRDVSLLNKNPQTRMLVAGYTSKSVIWQPYFIQILARR